MTKDEQLIESVAEAIYNNDREFCNDFEVCRDYAIVAIAAVRAHDAERTKLAIDAYMAGYDPDDYAHPLSLIGGPRHEKLGLQG